MLCAHCSIDRTSDTRRRPTHTGATALTLSDPPAPSDWIPQTPFSDPGDELLLWNGWGAIPPPGESHGEGLLVMLDEVAAQLVAADAEDAEAERSLYERYRRDPRLRPGAAVLQFSPVGTGPVLVPLGSDSAGHS